MTKAARALVLLRAQTCLQAIAAVSIPSAVIPAPGGVAAPETAVESQSCSPMHFQPCCLALALAWWA